MFMDTAGLMQPAKCLVETPGVNFTNVLQAAFTLADPKSAKKSLKLSSFIALLGSVRVKAVRRTLVKLTPGDSSITEEYSSKKNNEVLKCLCVTKISIEL